MLESLNRNSERLTRKPSGFVYMMIKPLGLNPTVYEDIHTLIRQKGVITVADRKIIKREEIEAHYQDIKYTKDGKVTPHFYPITRYLTGQEIEAMVVEDIMGKNPDEFVKNMRELVGNSNPLKTVPGQIRNLALEHAVPFMRVSVPSDPTENVYCRDNLVHCSDSLESAVREINLWFPQICGDHYREQFELIRK